MTDDTMNLQALLGRSAEANFLREMIGFAAQRLMDLEVGSLTAPGIARRAATALPSVMATASALGDAGRHRRASHP